MFGRQGFYSIGFRALQVGGEETADGFVSAGVRGIGILQGRIDTKAGRGPDERWSDETLWTPRDELAWRTRDFLTQVIGDFV
ncbi:hypothetical protein AAC03nite_33930 [Alicyclobacillus acidoterrestris]|nr:hypothetical protein AAC03nite_33930 [Alicyclobacillus acidoterrestris]